MCWGPSIQTHSPALVTLVQSFPARASIRSRKPCIYENPEIGRSFTHFYFINVALTFISYKLFVCIMVQLLQIVTVSFRSPNPPDHHILYYISLPTLIESSSVVYNASEQKFSTSIFPCTTYSTLYSTSFNVVDAGGSAYGNTPNEARRRR